MTSPSVDSSSEVSTLPVDVPLTYEIQVTANAYLDARPLAERIALSALMLEIEGAAP